MSNYLRQRQLRARKAVPDVRQEALAIEPAGGAHISECGAYRYLLWRTWGPGKRLLFVMLNPSTADGNDDDPTIRKCRGFAQRMGYDGIEVVNLYAYRATDPADLWDILPVAGTDIQGDDIILAAAARADKIICAWGAQARKRYGRHRARVVVGMLHGAGHGDKLWALRLLADGLPEHPLMLPYDLEPVRFIGESGQV